jgi:hypothetical protein
MPSSVQPSPYNTIVLKGLRQSQRGKAAAHRRGEGVVRDALRRAGLARRGEVAVVAELQRERR